MKLRLLLVEISEADLQSLRRGTPSDADVATVIRNLRKYQPRVIGLDLHRDLPQEPGHTELMQELQDVAPSGAFWCDAIEYAVPDERLHFERVLTLPLGAKKA